MYETGRLNFTLTRTIASTVIDDFDPIHLLSINAAANHRITIHRLDIGMEGSTPATTPGIVDFTVDPGKGTTSSTITAVKQDRGTSETVLGTFSTYVSTDTLPVPTYTFAQFALHQMGFYQYTPPRPLIVNGGEFVGLRYVGAAVIAINFTLWCSQ